MDMIKILTKERTASSLKRVKFNNIKNQISKRDENSLIKRKRFSFKMKKEKENSVKNELLEKITKSKKNLDLKKPKIAALEQGKYFMKKILQIKKEINKKDFSHNSESGGVEKSINDSIIMKKIGTDLKQSLIQFKFGSEFEFATLKSIKAKINKNKYHSNIIGSPTASPKLRGNSNKKYIDTNIHITEKNLDKSSKLDEDLSYAKLLVDKQNNSKLELLNNEEAKNNNQTFQNNINQKVKLIETNFSNKSNKSKAISSMPLINEKYRKLMIRGLVYDSFDDEEDCEDQINKDFFIMPNSLFVIILDTLIVFDIFYWLTYNPYLIASSTKFVYSNISFYDIYHFLMEVIYFVDFLVQFVRAYHDFDENLVTIKKKIIIHYLYSYFLIDLITVIPTFTIIKLYYEKDKYKKGFDYLCNYGCQSENIMHLLCFIKLLKVLKISNQNQNQFISFIWSHLSNSAFIDNWGTLIFQVILAIFSLHITACFHIIIGRNSYPNWIIEHNLSTSKFIEIYIASIYFLIATMTSVGYGDITGCSLKEHIFQIFLLIIGIMAYSWLVSSISNYFIENNKDNIYFESKVNILDEIKLSHPKMDNELYNKIYLYLKQLTLIHKKKDKNILLDSLPYNIRHSLLYEINRPLIEGLNFFKNFHNSTFILSAVNKLIPIVTNKGDIIIEQNEIINSMIFVKQGRLSVEIAVDMNNIYNEIDNYINGTFILGDEEKDNNKDKDILKEENYKRKNAFSLMTTLNYTMDDTFLLDKGRDLNLNYKKPVSFRKRLLKFMRKKFGSNIEKQKNTDGKKIKFVKLYYIRKGEQFGEIFMFLNKPSSFTLRVRSEKAELLLLKKIDAIEISSNYPNIWKRANKKSFKNLIHLKELVSKEMIKFCGKNGIKYNLSYKLEDIKRARSSPDKEKLEKDKEKKNNLTKKFKNFKRNSVNYLFPLKKIKEKKNVGVVEKNENDNIKNCSSNANLKYQSTKLITNENNNHSILNLSDSGEKEEKEEQEKKKEDDKNNNITPYKEDEINEEIYIGEEFIRNINKDINFSNQSNYEKEISFNLLKYKDINNNIFGNKKNKIINKLIDSSRGKGKNKIYYHKSRENSLKNKNNYNFHYNINNSFNINQIQKIQKFCINELVISNTISFNIDKIYDNLNIISKGNYKKDINFQKRIKSIIQDKYIISNSNNIVNSAIRSNLNKKGSRKDFIYSSSVAPKQTFFRRNSKVFSLIKENDIKNEQRRRQKRKSIGYIKESKINKDEKDKKSEKEKDEGSDMLNQITRNIIEGERNLNNPEIFYNQLFANIIQNKNIATSSTMIMKNKNNQFRSSIKKGIEDKKLISKKKSMLSLNAKNLLK